jgi:ABC-type phosphate transport system permease subunit
MTHLQVLIVACFLLTVMGLVVAVPLGWTIVIGMGKLYPEKLAAVSLPFWSK